MEREPSPPLDDDEEEAYPYLDMPEPLTLTKQQYQATFEAVKKAYSKRNAARKPPVVPKKKPPLNKTAAKGIKKSRM